MSMWREVTLFPERASTAAGQVDALFFFLLAVSAFFTALICILITYFAVKYRQRPGRERATAVRTRVSLEVAWMIIPLALTMVMFGWGAKVFFYGRTPPPEALEVFVVGKQWMWKFQHLSGRQEINELHVPRGQPVKLTMISEDAIHDLFVPAFRVKTDVLPGRYSTLWFEATRSGSYHFFCAEYCGAEHSRMRGWVHVLEPAEYAAWVRDAAEPLAVAGARLFDRLGCLACHGPTDTARGPTLTRLFGKRVQLANGETIVANEDYIRESVLRPEARLTAGYEPLMPTFTGIVSEEGVHQLIAYLKSLGEVPP